MENITFLLYIVLFIITLVLGGYNFMYAREVDRIEHNIGVTLPLFIHRLLKITTILSFFLLGITTLMTIVVFFISRFNP